MKLDWGGSLIPEHFRAVGVILWRGEYALCIFNRAFGVRERTEASVMEIKEGPKSSLGARGGLAESVIDAQTQSFQGDETHLQLVHGKISGNGQRCFSFTSYQRCDRTSLRCREVDRR
jgi:hypothetical protein